MVVNMENNHDFDKYVTAFYIRLFASIFFISWIDIYMYCKTSNQCQLYRRCAPECVHMFVYVGYLHDDVIKWKHFPRYWPFVREIHRSPHKGQWRGALMISLICVWINDWVNNREAGDLRRHRAHYDVIVMIRVNREAIINEDPYQ